MSPERWQRVVELFESTVALPQSERNKFLAQQCGGDTELRSQVESMVAADEAGALESGGAYLGASALLADDGVDRNVGRRIGKYKILREIGRGGMGAVYEAERDDEEFRRRVAVKLIKRGMDTDIVHRRFRHERQILANLSHPYIASLLDGGTTDDGLPYFVMEYVDGVKITDYCKRKGLGSVERLDLVLKVCEALDYAHHEHIVHRDIKPGNILVTNDGQIKLLDFGIAKLLDRAAGDTADTATGRLMMTPEYASPEQLLGIRVTAASDVYSLGVLLYQLITGKHPFLASGASSGQLIRAAYESPLDPPSAVGNGNLPDGHLVNSDLDAVVLKALRKDPAERYQSAAELAGDLERYLKGSPVKAEAVTRIHKPSEPAEKTIAVLPFKFMSLIPADEDTDKSFLGLGLTDALVTRLANIRSLTVRPTSAVLKYTEDTHDLFAVGRELDVSYVLDGRITLAKDRLRVTVQLVSVHKRSSLWAGQYNEDFTDFFAVQDSISEQVSTALETELSDRERIGLAKRGTENRAAYEVYLRGRAIWHSYTEDGMARAVNYFRKATELDPDFGAAHSGLADLYIALGIGSVIPPAEAFAVAKASAKRALELDPGAAEAYASLGFAVWVIDWDARESGRLFRRSFAISENYAPAHEWFAHVLASQGRFDEAVAHMKHALRIDPNSSQLYAMTAYILHNARRPQEAVRYIEHSVELDPNNYIGLQGFGWIYPAVGRTYEAIPYCRKAVEISDRAPFCIWTLAEVLAQADERSEAEDLLKEIKRISADRYVSPYYAAMIHTTLGQYDDAFRSLEKVFDDHDYWAHWLGVEYRFDPIRNDPRFRQLLERLKPRTIETQEITSDTQAGGLPNSKVLWALAALAALALLLAVFVVLNSALR